MIAEQGPSLREDGPPGSAGQGRAGQRELQGRERQGRGAGEAQSLPPPSAAPQNLPEPAAAAVTREASRVTNSDF